MLSGLCPVSADTVREEMLPFVLSQFIECPGSQAALLAQSSLPVVKKVDLSGSVPYASNFCESQKSCTSFPVFEVHRVLSWSEDSALSLIDELGSSKESVHQPKQNTVLL